MKLQASTYWVYRYVALSNKIKLGEKSILILRLSRAIHTALIILFGALSIATKYWYWSIEWSSIPN
jgi:hypothetical protein